MDSLILKLQDWGMEYGIKILAALAILIIGWWASKIVRKIAAKVMEKSKVEKTLVTFVSNLVYYAVLAFVIIASLSKVGIQTASFVAVLGAAGLAVGLALQGSLANFAAGVLMIIFKPFKVGDFVEGAGVTGIIEEIGIFTVGLRSPDNKKIIVPNAKITSDNIINYSAKDTRRVDLVAGVSYSDDIDKVKSVLKDILDNHELVLKDPAPTIGVTEMADSSVNLVVRPWVKTENYWDAYFGVQETIKKRFDKEGICIPFPQRDIHLFNEKS